MPEEIEEKPAVTWLTMHEVLDVTSLSYRELEDLAAQGAIRSRRSGGATLYCAEDVRVEGP
jgi:hypothetical protein